MLIVVRAIHGASSGIGHLVTVENFDLGHSTGYTVNSFLLRVTGVGTFCSACPGTCLSLEGVGGGGGAEAYSRWYPGVRKLLKISITVSANIQCNSSSRES